ncbi:MAG TPA: TOBE domain-containing protein [Acidimicrobiales bacterium]|nr:TOBE domain-containing protein [Acidimicrobiales bacterium]
MEATRSASGRRRVKGTALAKFARSHYQVAQHGLTRDSARNHLYGIVTRVVKDKVMAHVEVQAGPFRMVALISREAADDMDLTPGVIVNAVVKATNVSIERTTRPPIPVKLARTAADDVSSF